MMILNLFRTYERELEFGEKEWSKAETKNSYVLSIDLNKIKIRKSSRFLLFVLQGSRYVFLSEGSEVVQGSKLQYTSHFPFTGKVLIK